MAGYIGSKASVVSSGAERKKTFAITTSTTSLTGLSYTPTKAHVFHNGVRLVDGTDYTATNGTSITLNSAAENGDEVVVISYAGFQVADAYTQAEADAEFVAKAGDTMTGGLTVGGSFTSLGIDDNATSTAVTIDSAGRVTMPYQPAFDVAYSGSGYGLKSPVIFDAAYLNVGGHYSISTGRFTAPVSGSYLFYTAFIKNGTNGTARRRFEKNATDPLGGRHFRMDSGQSYGDNGTLQATIYLSAGDYVTVAHTEGSSYGRPDYDYFGGYLIG